MDLVIKNRDFKLLVVSQILSQITIQLMNFVLILKIYNETKSSIATSVLWITYALPTIIVGPIASTAVDFFNRKKILFVSNLLQFILVLFYGIFHYKSLYLIYVVVFLYSIFNQFYLPAESALLTTTVNIKKLHKANSIFFFNQQIAIIIGFVFAGMLYKLIGFNQTVIFCSLLLFIATVSSYFIKNTFIISGINKNIEDSIVQFFGNIIIGYKYIKSHIEIINPIIVMLFIQILLTIFVINIPVIAKDIAHINYEYSGLFIVLPTILGSIYSSILLSRNSVEIKFHNIHAEINKNLKILSILILIMGLVIPVIPIFLIRIFSLILILFIAGYIFIKIYIPSQVSLQNSTPKKLMGRIYGTFWFLLTLITMFPLIFSGIVTELMGIKLLFVIIPIFIIIFDQLLKSENSFKNLFHFNI